MDTNYRLNEDIAEWNQVYVPRETRKEQAMDRRKEMLREKRRRKRRMKKIFQAWLRLGVLLIVLVIILTTLLSLFVKWKNGLLGNGTWIVSRKEASKPNYHETKELSVEQVRGTDIYRYVCEHPELYPTDMATKLENNPELLTFVSHYLEYEPVARGIISAEERKEQYPLFNQWDERWGYASYGDDNIGFSGCGPTCLSMVIYSLTRNENATPDAIGEFAMQEGYYVYGTGTSWDLMTAAPGRYGVNASTMSLDEGMIKNSLDAGQLLIASMGPGDFTTSGHFIVIYGYNEDGLFVNDPNSKKRSNQVWRFDDISWQIRNLWVYYK